jgi:hypothetical protein
MELDSLEDLMDCPGAAACELMLSRSDCKRLRFFEGPFRALVSVVRCDEDSLALVAIVLCGDEQQQEIYSFLVLRIAIGLGLAD